MAEAGGKRLEGLIRRSGLSKAEVARRAKVSRQTLYDAIARGTAAEDSTQRIAAVLGILPDELFDGPEPPSAPEPFTPNPRYRKRLPPRAYATVYGYLSQMEGAGASLEQLDEAERVMVDGAYNKLNSRDIRDRTEDEMIMDIDAAWAFIRDVLRDEGMKLK